MPQNLTPQGCKDALVALLQEIFVAYYKEPVDVKEIAPGDFDGQGQLILKKVAVRVVFDEATYGQSRDITRTNLQVNLSCAIACRHQSLRSEEEMRDRSLALAQCAMTYLAGAVLQLPDGTRSEPILIRTLGPARDAFGPVENTYALGIEVSGFAQFPGTQLTPQAVAA